MLFILKITKSRALCEKIRRHKKEKKHLGKYMLEIGGEGVALVFTDLGASKKLGDGTHLSRFQRMESCSPGS
jgi:hypothetical protein